MIRSKIYVARRRFNGQKYELLRTKIEPTLDIFRQYSRIFGPFKTVRAANFFINHLCLLDTQCSIVDIERMALAHDTQSELIEGYKKHLDK